MPALEGVSEHEPEASGSVSEVQPSLLHFRQGLESHLGGHVARPFVCDGSPLDCISFIVGLNAATVMPRPFQDYWSDSTGFDRAAFDADYCMTRKKRGSRPVIEAISREIGPCLETNLYAVPTKDARRLTEADRRVSAIEYLLDTIKPKIVFVHIKESIAFFEHMTGCSGFEDSPKLVTRKDYRFVIQGRRGRLSSLGVANGSALGRNFMQHVS